MEGNLSNSPLEGWQALPDGVENATVNVVEYIVDDAAKNIVVNISEYNG
jgi:hypothetical protein